MTANQTQIPSVQTSNDSLNQVQQNINKVLRNLNNQIVSLQNEVSNLEIIGEVKLSPLTLAQFVLQAGSDWISANGQSVVGTQYAILFKLNNVPNISITGLNAFIKVN